MTMIPRCQAAPTSALCHFATATMDGSANDRATKRQRGEPFSLSHKQSVDECSDHTLSTAGSSHSSNSTIASVSTAGVRLGKNYRRVSFAPVTEIHGTDWTLQEVERVWYSKDELATFKQERKALVKTLKRVQFDLSQIDPSIHCLRGYEAYFSIQANKEYKLKRQMVWKAVLQEQARQRYLGRTDGMMMQLVSSHATQWARDTACELGTVDAQVALQIFLEYVDQDELEDFDECDEEWDDAPIAVDWNEPLDMDATEQQEWSLHLEPLPVSGSELELNRSSHSTGHPSSSSSMSSLSSSSSHSHNSYLHSPKRNRNSSNRDRLCGLPPLQPYPTTNQSNETTNNSSSYMPQHLSLNCGGGGSNSNTQAARAS